MVFLAIWWEFPNTHGTSQKPWEFPQSGHLGSPRRQKKVGKSQICHMSHGVRGPFGNSHGSIQIITKPKYTMNPTVWMWNNGRATIYNYLASIAKDFSSHTIKVWVSEDTTMTLNTIIYTNRAQESLYLLVIKDTYYWTSISVTI